MAYERIENYGVIGNMRTVALVSLYGSIDWLCFPHFDSPSVFSALLDDEKGGRFSIQPTRDGDGRVPTKQLYWPDTNVLTTRFLSPDGVAELEDFMPCGAPRTTGPIGKIRSCGALRVVRGEMTFDVRCEPMFDYGRVDPRHDVQRSRGGIPR